MGRFIEGVDRTQGVLLPERLDDYIDEENPVRVVDVFVGQLDLGVLGFDGVKAANTGRPGYHPAVLLKLYVYGYLNRIQSSRRLEREARRNVELMWLLERLAPDFKTIADFRRDNGQAIRNVCRQFVALCRGLDLFADSIIAIDGSKFKAVNNRDKNFTPAKIKHRMAEIEASIDRYLAELDTADRQEPEIAQAKSTRLRERIAVLKERMGELQDMESRLAQNPDGQVSLTDPDARSMKTRGTGIVGYNVQAAVDSRHHLIVAHEVVNDGVDRNQLSAMAKLAQVESGIEDLTVVADRGYYKGEEIRACHEAGITPIVPKIMTSAAKAEGRFDKADFIYRPASNDFLCPAGDVAIWRFSRIEGGLRLHRYWSSHCPRCHLKAQCTPSDYRRISRWEHQNVLDAMERRLDRRPDSMRIRRQTVEHPFGTLKLWMGSAHFLTRRLPNVRTEMSLHVLAYNLKRVMKILGAGTLIAAMQT
jgi:transposase